MIKRILECLSFLIFFFSEKTHESVPMAKAGSYFATYLEDNPSKEPFSFIRISSTAVRVATIPLRKQNFSFFQDLQIITYKPGYLIFYSIRLAGKKIISYS